MDDDYCKLTILDLPDHFIVSICKHLSYPQRFRMAQTCKRFYSCVNESASLWTWIDLREFKYVLTSGHLQQFLHQYGSTTKHLTLAGMFITSNNNNHNFLHNNLSLTNRLTFLDEQSLFKCCANLERIELESLDLSRLRMDMFLDSFKHLKAFSLKLCQIDTAADFFFFNNSSSSNNNVKCLNLMRTGTLYASDIENVCKLMPHLSKLVIDQAQSTLGDDAVEIVVNRLKSSLSELDLVNTLLSDDAIYQICASNELCSQLVRLNLSMSTSISNACLATIATRLRNLNTLYLTSCFGISNVQLLQNLTSLSYLNINNTSIAKETIGAFLAQMPKCEVDYGHHKVLNRKLMWTINGSRNAVCGF